MGQEEEENGMTRKRATSAMVLRNAYGGNGGLTLTNEDREAMRTMALNVSLMRSTLLNKLIDDRRDIDLECGYPKELTTTQYKLMYDREGVATRVVNIYPEESWRDDPEVYEDEKPEDTEFEKAWKDLEMERQLYSYMAKVDEVSGIGRFGVLLLGFDDGEDLSKPVEGIGDDGAVAERTGKDPKRNLLYLRAFDESVVTVKEVEKDMENPRYGKPKTYTISFDTIAATRSSSGEIRTTTSQEKLVHWTRVIHVADNRRSSEVYGIPRMQTLFNRLYDLRKIAGGSGEMFWKGGFPGYSFEMDPNARALTPDQEDDLTDEIANYANGLQRYMKLQGVTVNSLEPQVADPSSHVETELELIAIAMGIPKRVFIGSEQAQLSSSQDTKRWNQRISRRQNKYLSPYIVRPTIDRLIAAGVLPAPKESYMVSWPDLDTPSEKDKAEVLKTQMEALAKYVAGNVDQVIPQDILLTMFMGMDEKQAKAIEATLLEREKELEADEEALAAEEAAMREEEERRAAEGEEA